MDSNSENEECCILGYISAVNTAALCVLENKEKKKKKKREWVKLWKLRRVHKGTFNLHKELILEDKGSFRRYLRMNEDCFLELLELIKPRIQRQDTRMRRAISAEECLSAVLRFLATGETYRSLEFQTRISLAFISERIPEICKILYQDLQKKYLQFPVGEEWQQIANKFETRWHFPLCIGALDGKHVAFRASKTDGALYYNYKGFNSVVLLAMCDADYRFTFVDIGCNGRISDGGVLSRSALADVLLQANAFFPNDRAIGNNRLLPYVIVGDDAFALEKHVMKPFPYHTNSESEKNFNFRLSHARQTIEHSFGILANRFRVLQSNIHLRPHKVVKIIQACCVLHNFLISKSLNYASDLNFESETSASGENADGNRASNPRRHTNEAGKIRNQFAEYFSNEGKLYYV